MKTDLTSLLSGADKKLLFKSSHYDTDETTSLELEVYSYDHFAFLRHQYTPANGADAEVEIFQLETNSNIVQLDKATWLSALTAAGAE